MTEGISIEAFLSAPAIPLVSSREAGIVAGKESGLVSRSPEGLGSGGEGSSPDSWVLPLEHFSASSLNMLAVCPRQFQQRYLRGRKEPPSQAQVVGSSFHKTMEYNFRQKIESFNDLEATELNDYLIDDAFPGIVDQEQESTGFKVEWDDQNDALLAATSMVASYRREVSPGIQPQKVEDRFTVQVSDTPIPVVGVIDVVDDVTIIDLKSSKRKVNSIKSGWRMQGRIYQLSEPKHTSFHVVTTKGDVMPKLVMPYSLQAYFQTQDWVSRLAWTANFYYSRYGDEEWPALGIAHDWRCGWCGYKSDCPAWRA